MAQLLNFVGTGGIIEGNLNDLPVNVNLDAVLDFDGVGDLIDCGTGMCAALGANYTGNLTASLWFKADVTSGNDGLLSIGSKLITVNDNGTINIMLDGNNIKFGLNDSGWTRSIPFTDTTGWHHLMCVYKTGSVGNTKIYLDGIETTGSTSGSFPATSLMDFDDSRKLVIGAYYNNGYTFDGQIADVRIYSNDLGSTEAGILASKIGVDNSIVQSSDTRIAHYMLTTKYSGSKLDESGFDASETDVSVDDGTDFTDNDYQHILIDDEVMRVTNISTNVLTAARGGTDDCGTTAASHSDNSRIYIIGLEDLSTNNNAVTLVGNLTTPSSSLVYDAFSVNVQDGLASAGGTTTDGTVTVTQGKLEGLSLSYLDFESGNSDKIDVASSADFAIGTGDATVSLWFKAETTSGTHLIYRNTASSTNYGIFLQSNVLNAHFRDSSNSIKTATNAFTDTSNWHNVVLVRSSSVVYAYLDGVPFTTTGVTGANKDYASHTRLSIGHDSSANYYDGKLRDVKFFDYALSSDQASSLYSGSYNVTPEHQWKMDEGTSNALDTGTGTGVTGTVTGADWTNGTLDLDSTLTIAANGTLSAPRGNLDLAAAFDNSSTIDTGSGKYGFKHNNGRFVLSGGSKAINNNGGSANTAFYELYCSSNSGSRTELFDSMAVEKEFRITGGLFTTRDDTAAPTITMGTSSVAGKINTTVTTDANNGFNVRDKAFIYAADQLKPYTVEGNEWALDEQTCAVSGGLHLKWADFQYALVTDSGQGTNHPTITLDGDCEFDEVTISAGDTLDLNGQRLFSSGIVNCGAGGVLDLTGGSHLIHDRCNWNGTGNDDILTDSNTVIWNTSSDAMAIGSNAVDNGGRLQGVFITDSSAHTIPYYKDQGGLVCSKLIVMSGLDTVDGTNNIINCTDLTVPTGATLNARASTITASGDFTTSGGLLGASCLKFPTSASGDKRVVIPVSASENDHIKAAFGDGIFTVEGWIKMDTNFVDGVWCNKDAEFAIHIARSGATLWALAEGNANGNFNFGANAFAMPNLEDGKWHHLAFCRRYTGSQGYYDIYVDGKLEVVHTVGGTGATWSATDSDFVVGAYAANGSSGLERCHIENIRIWGTTRTAPQIRADMFNSTPTSSASDCIANFTFNEGTSTIITASDPNSMSSNETAGAWDGDWAGAGTFTEGSGDSGSTLKMTGTGSIITKNGDTFNKLWIASGTTTLKEIVDGDASYTVKDDLTIAGTMVSTTNEYIYLNSNFGSNSGALVLGGTLTGLSQIINDSGANVSIPAHTTKTWKTYDGATSTQTADVTITTELEVANGGTWNVNGNTIHSAELDVNGGTLNLSNSTLKFSVSHAHEWNMSAASTLTTGNTTVTGYSAAQPSPISLPDTSPSSSNFEIVGDVSNLKAGSLTDLTVIGSVTNCTTSTSTAIIRQWHHTLDTQQLLDADSDGDDDLRLTRPALDNSHELQTG